MISAVACSLEDDSARAAKIEAPHTPPARPKSAAKPKIETYHFFAGFVWLVQSPCCPSWSPFLFKALGFIAKPSCSRYLVPAVTFRASPKLLFGEHVMHYLNRSAAWTCISPMST